MRPLIKAADAGRLVTGSAARRLRSAHSKRWATSAIVAHADDVHESVFAPLDVFLPRHVGPRPGDVEKMLKTVGYDSLDAFVDDVVPASIRIPQDTVTDGSIKRLSESEMLRRAKELASKNKLLRNFIGQGYHNAVVPPVILRNITENPAWYTSYTPYQPEISQGRLESLLNYQTVATSLTGLAISNASLLDEGTAAAEAMTISYSNAKTKKKTFLVDKGVLPQTRAVLRTRAEPWGIKIVVGDARAIIESGDKEMEKDLMGVLVQYPTTNGHVYDWQALADKAHSLGALVTCATDLLALTMLKPPGEWGADMAVGNSARFGVPLGYGGPHAAFFSCSDAIKRKMPGRLIGLSKDAAGQPAYRLALQTREQHIRREKATSNICTAQALLANMAAMYAVYHGPEGLTRIANKVHALATIVKAGLESINFTVQNDAYFDTLTVQLDGVASDIIHGEAEDRGINLRRVDQLRVGITLDESFTIEDIVDLLNVFVAVSNSRVREHPFSIQTLFDLAQKLGLNPRSTAEPSVAEVQVKTAVPEKLRRTTPFLTQSVFNTHRSETEMLRYINTLQCKDLSLIHAIIPLGSCTMKLNSTTSMMPLTWTELGSMHPFAPVHQAKGYKEIMEELGKDLCRITGLPAVSLQPNSGAQGEYAGLSVIRAYHRSRGDEERDVCLVPLSAHGTNPASAIMAGMRVIPVKNLNNGYLDLEDLRVKAEQHKDQLAAFMVTYPSTFGIFEEGIQEACEIVHANGGQVYLDGANLNAMVGITSPGKCGADVTHMNLHKTFSIPHGGGGPGQGPICVAEHLAPFLPGHPVVKTGGAQAIEPVSAAPFGSPSILAISWAYIRMLGGTGLTYASKIALLSANYCAARLKDHYKVRFINEKGLCAHEFIIDLVDFDKSAGLKVMDFAKRLQDYSIHPPTCSWPLNTAMLIEPTESEGLAELDRFCDAMLAIKGEADAIIDGSQPRGDNIITNAPHPITSISTADWNKSYTREQAVYPDKRLRHSKFWPPVARIDDAYGDRNLICECPSVEELAEQ